MKRETLRHPKAYALAAALGCSRPTALGYLVLLWDYTGEVAPRGNIGKWPNGVIAMACDWNGDADEFIKALVDTSWLDEDETHRLIIHDWADHCERFVKAKLERTGEAIIEPNAKPCTQRAHTVHEKQQPARTVNALSNPIQSNPNQTNTADAVCPEAPPSERAETLSEYEFPVVGKASKVWRLSMAKLDEYRDAFPGVDIDAELRKARQWCRDNPPKRKTANGMPGFLTRWLGKAQNSNRGSPASTRNTAQPMDRLEI